MHPQEDDRMTVLIPPIISVDDHLVEPPDLWQRWLPAKFRESGPRVVSGPWEMVSEAMTPRALRSGWTAFRVALEGPMTDWWIYEDLQTGTLIGNASAGLAPGDIGVGPIRFEDMRRGCYDAKARLDDMDRNHVERSLCFPTFARFCGQTFLNGHDKEVALACVRAYNDFMVEEWAGESGGRLIPLCLIPLWDASLAAAEVRRNASRGVRAVAFSELPAALGLASIHDRNRYWDPFFAACDETGTVICMHIGSSSQMPITSLDAPTHVQISLTSINSQMSMSDWLLSGLLVRFPNLKLAYSEGQIGWMPYQLERLDTLWRKRHYIDEWEPLVTEPPSHYVRGHIWGCFFEDDFGLSVRDTIGIDVITFETDYPHQDSTWPYSLEYAEKVMGDLPQADVEKIVRQNAIALFELPKMLPGRS
jgi:predicted TIM-barrel fold metal-dependent hydrolase